MASEDGSSPDRTSGGNFGDKLSAIFSGSPAGSIDPAAAINGGGKPAADPGDGSGAPRGRGRPLGSKTRASQKAKGPVHIDLSGLEKLLISVHVGLAAVLKTPEFELDPTEAKSIAEALARVSKHYPVLEKIGDKAIDHTNLFVVMGGVYGSRVVAWKFRKAGETARPMGDGVVTPIRPGNGYGA